MTQASRRFRLACHDSLPSTSDFCIARAEAGEPAGLAVLARQQTRGRGSRGRSWTDAPGNLALSVLLRPEEHPATVWPFVAALALYDGLSAILAAQGVDAQALALKWPNDVLAQGRKLAGILVESGDADPWVVIGMGVNLAGTPDIAGRDPGCLAAMLPAGLPPPDPETVAALVLDGMARWIDVLKASGFDAIRHAWLGRAHPLGTALAVTGRDVDTRGSFAGLDRDGALLIETGGTVKRIDTGDVLQLNTEPR